jgi:hypothetical protein
MLPPPFKSRIAQGCVSLEMEAAGEENRQKMG